MASSSAGFGASRAVLPPPEDRSARHPSMTWRQPGPPSNGRKPWSNRRALKFRRVVSYRIGSMSDDAECDRILAEVAEAFRVPRPEWFCDARHCCECAEHEAELQAQTVETLRREVL